MKASKLVAGAGRAWLAIPCLGVVLLVVAKSPAAGRAFSPNPAEVFGVAHVDGKYYLTPQQDFLDEGADQVLATGSKVIKLYLTPRRYPWNSHWPEGITSLVQMAQTPYFKSVFAKPFHTYILTAYAIGREDHYWTTGIDAAQAADETRQFYDLTRYLLSAYKGTGKTFVLQHWEGDWALRHGSTKPYDATYVPSPTAVQGMIQWLNARQAGIIKARAEAGSTDVRVFGATEANRLEDSLAGKPGVANSVLPFTTVDLVSYSCYESLDSPAHLARAVDYLAAHLPPTAVFGQNPHSVYLGEFGYPENGKGGVEELNRRIDTALDVVRDKGLPWAVFWEVYCNEPVTRGLALPLNGAQNDANLRGFWMIKPDGSPALAWHRYRRLFALGDRQRVTTRAIKSHAKLVYSEQFQRPDGGDLGPGWTQAAHYGLVAESIAHHRLHLEVPDGRNIPWGSATLDLSNPAVLGHGLQPGDYFELTLERLGPEGALGVELFDSDQLRVGSGFGSGPASLETWNGKTWVPISLDAHGRPLAFDWNKPRTLGVCFDSADGYRATFSYYIDGAYAGSWLVATGQHTLDKFGIYVQSKTSGAAFDFDVLNVYEHRPARKTFN
ncbi:MAG TPA: hypothetical protein VG167_01730 [Verrucomicrobiae bacterium]|nr:hypothetical protein [Verrucomicrobiae bacterium]